MVPESRILQAKHLNTPRLVADDTQKTVWKWEQQEPFGAGACNPDPDGDNVAFEFNLRFPGQYFDRETNLHYNYFRDYDPSSGRYAQSDPIGLNGGIHTYLYAEASSILHTDRLGLFSRAMHRGISIQALTMEGVADVAAKVIAEMVVNVDGRNLPDAIASQMAGSSHRHAMCSVLSSKFDCIQRYNEYIVASMKRCTPEGLADALHAVQDSAASGHQGFQRWPGLHMIDHWVGDNFPTMAEIDNALARSRNVIREWTRNCSCRSK